jgi:hypothetical protein
MTDTAYLLAWSCLCALCVVWAIVYVGSSEDDET